MNADNNKNHADKQQLATTEQEQAQEQQATSAVTAARRKKLELFSFSFRTPNSIRELRIMFVKCGLIIVLIILLIFIGASIVIGIQKLKL